MQADKFMTPLTTPISMSWLDDDVFATTIMNAFSIGLPVGERFFIKSLKEHMSLLDNEDLVTQCTIFIEQEVNHSKLHQAYNKRFCETNGLDLGELEAPFINAFHYLNSERTPQIRLATTVAIEHLTAITSTLVFEERDWAAPDAHLIKRFWAWHCFEELEHCSVAFDVYQQVYDEREVLREVFDNTLADLIRLYKLTAFSIVVRTRSNIKAFRQWLETGNTYRHFDYAFQQFSAGIAAFHTAHFHPTHHFTVPAHAKPVR
ncbi:metal-dependent hydrolase [Alteromonas sp. ASW11-130]|uniref:metal-dependent hydrolase n=1 Tax=Alteromonas sp. ASW11-130 TaxID=3015775 RepID=UPI002242B41C|nr:metal-dependent hydrolase [Alteromonas sp. ASW11-130]MCW8090713.1 metal-dependent hydrolase [Alteromonas sp. ASW11-130]